MHSQQTPQEKELKFKIQHEEQYRIGKLKGKGQFGSVYSVMRPYAMKILHQEPKPEDQREIEIMKSIKNPYVNKIRDFYINRDRQLVIIQDLAIQDLKSYIKEMEQNLIEESQLLEWTAQLAIALNCIHEKGIIHRDIKPQNILLFRNNQFQYSQEEQKDNQLQAEKYILKITDFGLAKIFDGDLNHLNQGNQMSAVGTIAYMAPEQSGNKYGVQVDIYAFGKVLFELMLKVTPEFEDINNRSLNIPPRYSQRFVNLVYRMCSIDSQKRPFVNDILEHPLITNTLTYQRSQQKGQINKFKVQAKKEKYDLGEIFPQQQQNFNKIEVQQQPEKIKPRIQEEEEKKEGGNFGYFVPSKPAQQQYQKINEPVKIYDSTKMIKNDLQHNPVAQETKGLPIEENKLLKDLQLKTLELQKKFNSSNLPQLVNHNIALPINGIDTIDEFDTKVLEAFPEFFQRNFCPGVYDNLMHSKLEIARIWYVMKIVNESSQNSDALSGKLDEKLAAYNFDKFPPPDELDQGKIGISASFANYYGYYEGSIKKTKNEQNEQIPYGRGKFIKSNGQILQGYFVNELLRNGRIIKDDGSIIIGQLKDEKMQGKVCNFSINDTGEFVYQESNYVNGNKNGKGFILWSDGEINEVDFVDDMKCGQGEFYFSSGAIYLGEWQNDQRTGQGTILYPNNDNYQGFFFKGKYEGRGVFTFANGIEEERVYKNGQLMSRQTIKK
eukprot:403354499